MRNVYLMLKLKFPGRSDLQDLTPELFERYKEYLLGDYVHNLQARDSSDNVVHTPPWQLVLAYEQAVRKQAFHYMVLDSLSIAAAWEKAWKDPVTKERHFSTPLSLHAKRKPADLALFRDLKQPPHRDSTNGPEENLLLACTSFQGGRRMGAQSDDRSSAETWRARSLSGRRDESPLTPTDGTLPRTGRGCAWFWQATRWRGQNL